MSLKFVQLSLVEDPDERFFCWGCNDWNAVMCVVNEDDTWQGYACCENEEHAALAVKAHSDLMFACPDDATPFWDDPTSWLAGSHQ